ncbi:MAG: sodium:solute symporter family protein [Bacteroidetes bacterium]|nr:MAG: sodium:solute symporter family protein [Bacteroidota bacterium]
MHIIDVVIFMAYLLLMLGVGLYFMRRTSSMEDYYVGGRKMSAGHIGLSVVATDVGGGFSIGLGGLGFVMGISGSWMLFTGLLGAWLSSVLLIPRVHKLSQTKGFLTFPDLLKDRFGLRVALLAGIISFIGYVGFTSSQILAGAKLATATFDGLRLEDTVILMGAVVVLYTVIGGIKAVIYTDTIQWLILILGLIGIGIPVSYWKLGGWEAITSSLPASFLSLQEVELSDAINWLITIVPIWFVGMTLYQRIYACKDEGTAKKAWRIAGLFEWPAMAFMGVVLGLFARSAHEQGLYSSVGYTAAQAMDSELGVPLLLVHVLPVGLLGLMMSAYFSAIMSTADSCLMAASGNLVSDILPIRFLKKWNPVRKSQLATLVIGMLAIVLSSWMTNVLELMLYSYAFMVSGLFVPVMGALFSKQPNPIAALLSMLIGGGTTLLLILWGIPLPGDLDPNFFGLSASFIVYVGTTQIQNKITKQNG